MIDRSVASAISEFAGGLPADQVEEAACFLDRAADFREAANSFTQLVANERFRVAAERLVRASGDEPDLPPSCVAFALRSAASAVAAERASQKVELVWTGPTTVGIPIRYTHGVLVELIAEAVRDVTLVSFAAYRADIVSKAVREASRRGVRVRFVLDGGTDAKSAFAALGNSVELYTWPPTLLPKSDRAHASMHAKVAIADARIAFVTSANLTGHALDRNMELGVQITGGTLPKRLAAHFDALITGGELAPFAEV